MRFTTCCILLLASAVPGALAENRVKLTLIASRVTDRVIAVHATGDASEMAKIGKFDDPDPWLIADALWVLGKRDVAMAYARSAPRPDTAALPAYLEARGETAPNRDVRAAIQLADEAKGADPARAALEALDVQVDRGDVLERTLVEAYRGSILVAVSRFAEAAEAYQRAGDAAERVGWLKMAATMHNMSGHQAHADLNFDGMVSAWTRLLTVEQGRENHLGAGAALVFIGNALSEVGDYTPAVARLREGAALFARLKSVAAQAWALENLGLVLDRRGDSSEALRAMEEALALARRTGQKKRIAGCLASLGTLLTTIEDFDGALARHREALAMYEALNDAAGIAQCTGNIGHIHGRQGRHDEAVEHTRRAVAAYRELKDLRMLTAALTNLGAWLGAAGDPAAGKPHAMEALRLAAKLQDPWLVASVRTDLARIHRDLNEVAEAESLLKACVQSARQMASDRMLMVAHEGQAHLWHKLGKFDRAVHAAQRALGHATKMVTGLGQDRASIARHRLVSIHEIAIQSAVSLKRPGALFTAMEAARAGALLESLENRDQIRAAAVPETLGKRERDASREATAAVRRFQKALSGGDLRAVRKRRREMEAARKRLHAVVGQIQRDAKAAASVLYPEATTLDDAQRVLRAGEAVVIYSLLGEPPVALVVTPDAARIVNLPEREAIEAAMANDVQDPAVDPGPRVAALQEALVKPLRLEKKTRRLLISPDGALGYVPFRLIAGDREVVYVPSATAYKVLRDIRSEPGQGVLALGDPDYKLATVDAPKIAERGGMRLVPLPATRKEALAVGDVTLLGNDATPDGFLAAVKRRTRWKSVHLACHGLVDPDRPMGSALALSFQEDGRSLLTCSDVFRAQIHADLAVLSACETGQGKIRRGEGIVGLTQAFMLAGAPRVIVSLWKVDDKATQALMIKFYELWNPRAKPEDPERAQRVEGPKPMSAAAALKAAQEHVRAQKGWKHPYYWAAWVLWGLPD